MNYQMGLSILVLAFSACMKITKKGQGENSTKVSPVEMQVEQTRPDFNVSQVLVQTDIQIIYIGEEQPNNYTVILKWPETKNSILRIFNTNDEEGFDTVENSFVIKNKIGGNSQKIRFEQFDSVTEKRKSFFTIEIKPPEDMVFSGATVLSEDLIQTTERLFILADTRIYTQQFNLKIKAQKIISEEGAFITNFPADSNAALEQAGLSGGMIEVFSREAIGRLKIVLNGQNGGAGRFGNPVAKRFMGMIVPGDSLVAEDGIIPACLGNRGGLAGKSGSLVFSADESKDFILLAETELAKAGSAGDVSFKCFETHLYPEFKKICRPIKSQKCESNLDIPMSKIGESGQICTKFNHNDNFRCEKK